MKNGIKIFLAISAIIAMSGCKKFLTDEPQSVLTQVDFYKTPIRINQGVIGCYAGMATIMQDEWMFTENRTDNSCVSNTGTGTTAPPAPRSRRA